jgi:hypothetical protein
MTGGLARRLCGRCGMARVSAGVPASSCLPGGLGAGRPWGVRAHRALICVPRGRKTPTAADANSVSAKQCGDGSPPARFRLAGEDSR